MSEFSLSGKVLQSSLKHWHAIALIRDETKKNYNETLPNIHGKQKCMKFECVCLHSETSVLTLPPHRVCCDIIDLQ